jgi:phosphatidate cytidylyltransferase
MKTRVISSIIALLIFIPIFIMGGTIYNLTIYILAILSLREFIDIKETKKEMPNFIKFISYIIITLLVLYNINNKELIFSIDYRIVAGLFLTFLLPTVLYHDQSKYSVNDAFYLIGGMFFLGISFHLLILLHNTDILLLVYLFLITIFTDTFAYFTGFLIGRNKLLESISPKKTWEGLIGGTVLGVFVSGVFFHVVVDDSVAINVLILMTTFLSILGQFGDLAFSAIKRYFGRKDFSNLMPGHGGVLDRLDSIIFVMLGYMFFIAII